MTPLTRSNTDCVPQKHPPAKMAVCLPWDGARVASTCGTGTGVCVSAWVQPVNANASKAAKTSDERPLVRNMWAAKNRILALDVAGLHENTRMQNLRGRQGWEGPPPPGYFLD